MALKLSTLLLLICAHWMWSSSTILFLEIPPPSSSQTTTTMTTAITADDMARFLHQNKPTLSHQHQNLLQKCLERRTVINAEQEKWAQTRSQLLHKSAVFMESL